MLEDQLKEAGKTNFTAIQSDLNKLNRMMEKELANSVKHK